jgi:hypothetical protein
LGPIRALAKSQSLVGQLLTKRLEVLAQRLLTEIAAEEAEQGKENGRPLRRYDADKLQRGGLHEIDAPEPLQFWSISSL